MPKDILKLKTQAERLQMEHHEAVLDWWEFREKSSAEIQSMFENPHVDMLEDRSDYLHKWLWDDNVKESTLLRKARSLMRKAKHAQKRYERAIKNVSENRFSHAGRELTVANEWNVLSEHAASDMTYQHNCPRTTNKENN